MKKHNWERAVKHFCWPEHRRKSAINTVVRKKQVNTYRGGMSSYASHCYNKNFERCEAYRCRHTDRQGRFDSPENEENYNKLREDIDSQTQRIAQEEEEEGCSSSQQVDKVAIFENVVGRRRGHVRRIGPRPFPRETLPQPTQRNEMPPPQLTHEQFMAMMSDPAT